MFGALLGYDRERPPAVPTCGSHVGATSHQGDAWGCGAGGEARAAEGEGDARAAAAALPASPALHARRALAAGRDRRGSQGRHHDGDRLLYVPLNLHFQARACSVSLDAFNA